MDCDVRWMRKGPYPWLRVCSAVESRERLELLVGFGIATSFLLPWCGIPLLKWQMLVESPVFGEAWTSRSVKPSVSSKIRNSIVPMIEELFSIFTQTHPGAKLHLHSSNCIHGWKIRRELILDVRLRSRHSNLVHFSRVGSKILSTTQQFLDET